MMYGGEYMLIYAGTKSDFMIDIEHDSLETNHKVIFDYLFKSSYMPV